MEFRILGRLEVVDDGRRVQLDRRLSRALLAYLLLHANEPVSSDRLVDELWGDSPPKTAVASLQNTVSRLRKTIGSDWIELTPAGYVLRVDPESFDLAQFERLVGQTKGAPPQARLDLLRAALALWRGAPLEDLAYESFAEPEIAVLNEHYAEALEERIAAELELGAGSELVGELEELVHQHPLRERFRGHLMLALYRAGRQADALEAFAQARKTLHDELGLEPSAELRALQRQILEQDPTLLRGAEDARSVSRRTVTVLFCDLVESTRLAMRLDAEAYRTLLETYFSAVRTSIEAHGGTVEKFIGDAVMALFGVPELHEDDAMRAVRSAVDARDAVLRLNETFAREWDTELALRIAVNTGEVLASEGATGAPVNVAAHLEKRAGRNEIVLGAETYRLVRGAVHAEEIAVGDGLRAWRLNELTTEAPVIRRLDTPLVGRKKELRRLRAAFHRARKEERCGVATVVGEAGIGKTRLAREFVDSVRDEARIVVGRCVSYGAGATYLPIAEIVRSVAAEPTVDGVASLLGDDDDAKQIAQRIAQLVGFAEGPVAPGETFWAVRRLFEALASEQPLVIALDDIHWAEPTLLDLVEYLGEWAEGPMFVLCLARPDLLEARRPGWGGPTSTGFVLQLEPLPAEDVAVFVERLADGPVAPDIHAKIVEHSAGNPLFAEQLLALASEIPGAALDQAPSTIEALIASRLDALPSTELDVLQRASVIGRRFAADDLDRGALAGLERRGLVHPTLDGYRFHHVLVRDVAYRGIPKARRTNLHEAAAKRGGVDEIVGFHYEQAYRYLIELTRDDERALGLAELAGDHLGAAGIRAWKRADAPAAIELLGRAAALVRPDDERKAMFLCERGIALRTRGELADAEKTLSLASEAAATSGSEVFRLRAEMERAHIASLRGMGSPDAVVERARQALPAFEAANDSRALGRAWLHIGLVRGGHHCRHTEWIDAAQRAAAYYTRSGWSPSTCISGLAAAYFYGPTPASEALARCDDLLAAPDLDRATEANIRVWAAGLMAMRERFDEARAYVSSARGLFDEVGQTVAALDTCGSIEGAIELWASNPDAAEAALRRACEACDRMNEAALFASRASELGEVLYVQGRYDEAETWAQAARERTDERDVAASFAWRSLVAKIRARQRVFAEAETLASEALAFVERTDALNAHAQVLTDLAEVRVLQDRATDAKELRSRALDLLRRKENDAAANAIRARDVKAAIA